MWMHVGFPGHRQVAVLEVEQPGQTVTHMAASDAGCVFTFCDTVLAPMCSILLLFGVETKERERERERG